MSFKSITNKLFKIVGQKYIKLIGRFITMNISDNPKFSGEKSLQVFAYAGVTQNYVESSADKLRVANEKILTGET